MKRDADAGIFKHLGLKYGATVRFKDEFLKLIPSDLVKSPSPTTGVQLRVQSQPWVKCRDLMQK